MHVSILRHIVGAIALCASPVAAKTVYASQGNLPQLLNAAAPGDTIILMPGGYGAVVMPRKSWQTPINVDARAATMSGVVMFKASGVNWTGGTIIGTGYGISIQQSSRINVTGTDISAAQRGIVVNWSTDIKLVGNKLHGLRTDGIDVVGQRVLVEGNTIWDMNPIEGDHPDGIQLWSANGEQTRDVIVRGNTITGTMQGIFGRAPELGMSKIVVTGNKVSVSYPNGVVLMDVASTTATSNVVKSIVSAKFTKANMRVEGVDIIACNNTVPDVPKAVANKRCTT